MEKILKRIHEYSQLEAGDVTTRITKLTEELGEFNEAYLDRIAFYSEDDDQTNILNDHILEEGCDSLIMVLDILFKQGFSPKKIESERLSLLKELDFNEHDCQLSTMLITSNLGKWSAAYLLEIGFKVPKKPISSRTIKDNIFKNGLKVLVLIYKLLEYEFSSEEILSKIVLKLNAWDNVLKVKAEREPKVKSFYGVFPKFDMEEQRKNVKKNKGVILQNAILCKKCGTIVNSTHVHDYVVCGCENNVMVDGGLEYLKCSPGEGDSGELLYVHSDDWVEMYKNKLVWGTRGKDGTESFKWVKLIDCETSHLKAILENCKGIKSVHHRAILYILTERLMDNKDDI
jgi:hypothetical protein